MYTAIFISVLVFIGIVLFIFGIFYYISYRKEHGKLIDKIKGKTREVQLVQTTDTNTQEDSFLKRQFMKVISSLGSRVKPKKEEDITRMQKSFLRAGFRRQNALMVFFGAKAFFAILLPSLFILIKLVFTIVLSPVQFMFISILLALTGFYLPSLWLRIKTARRKEKILEGFPDALDLMVVCVEAGMGLDTAINRVGEEMKLKNKVISDEFRLLSQELRAGKLRRDALRNLAMRMDLEDINSLVSLLIQTDKFGTSIAQALRVHSDSMRTKRQQRAEEIAAKLPIKLVFPLILFIFPSLFVAIMGPAAIRIYRAFFGGGVY